jgi:predicted dehydrogenase
MNAFCNVGDSEPAGWKTDPKLAGGGVLLQDCYRMIDQIVWNFGMPQQVYSLHTNQAHDKQQRSYLTEDTAIVTMRFSDTFVGNFIASRRAGIGPKEEFVRLYGKDKIVTAGGNRLEVADGVGQVSEECEYQYDRLGCLREALDSFAKSVLTPEDNKLCSSGRENLMNMAVMEAAYLSARTGFPEEPEKILQMAAMGAGNAAAI